MSSHGLKQAVIFVLLLHSRVTDAYYMLLGFITGTGGCEQKLYFLENINM